MYYYFSSFLYGFFVRIFELNRDTPKYQIIKDFYFFKKTIFFFILKIRKPDLKAIINEDILSILIFAVYFPFFVTFFKNL